MNLLRRLINWFRKPTVPAHITAPTLLQPPPPLYNRQQPPMMGG